MTTGHVISLLFGAMLGVTLWSIILVARSPSRARDAHALTGAGTRFYGGTGTIHNTRSVNVETQHGRVVAVWFRCSLLPFTQKDVDSARAKMMVLAYAQQLAPQLEGVIFRDPPAGDTAATAISAKHGAALGKNQTHPPPGVD